MWRLNLEIKNQDNFINLIKIAMYSLFIGYLGYSFAGVILIFYPMLFMESTIKNGLIPTILAMLATSVILGLLINLLAGLALFFVFAPMVLIFHYCVESKKSYMFTLILMVIVLAASFTSYQMGITRIESLDLEAFIDNVVEMQVENLDSNLSNLELSRYEDNLRMIYEYSIILVPGITLIILGLTVYLNYVFVGRRLLVQGVLINQPPLFSNFQLPRVSIIIFGAFIAAILLMRYLGLDYYSEIYLNTIAVFGFIYFVNGLALFSNFLIRLRIPNLGRMLVYVTCFMFPPVGIVVAVLGLLDALIYFRRISIKRE